ncbi:MAG: CPBP family intramembrane metalloprotease, partial [Actinobacteria bacterium]|nr:CPBP family intramembrane metalloprotease [Actinomycetota bacterium]
GWLLMSLGARYTPWCGVVASSLLFSSFHAFNPGFGWLPALNLFLIGVFFALLVLRQGCLWGAFAMHAAWNWTLGNVLGLSVSGMGMPGGALVDLDIGGPAWLVGGAFGLEGGLAATAVATSGVLGMVALMRRRTVRGHIDDVAADGVDREGDRTRSPGEGSDDV